MKKSKYPPWSNIHYRKKKLKKGIEEIVKEKVDGEEVLVDYGCGAKPYEEVFAPYVKKYVGIDIEDGPNVDYVIPEDGKTTLKEGVADIVLSTQVLEHVPEPQQYLAEARRLLDKNGVLILSTHGHFFYHPVPVDYWRWTHKGLRKELETSGFRVEVLNGIVGKAATGAQFILDSVRPILPKYLKAIFNFVMQKVMRILDANIFNPNKNEDASIFLVVAKKE